MTYLKAQIYTEDIDPTGYWLSEKLDGIRAIWNGKNLISFNDNILPAPEWFTAKFPQHIPLDGELWIGRGRFNKASSIVRSGRQDKGWNQVSYTVFDIPEISAGVVEARWNALTKIVNHTNEKHLQFLPQMQCTGREQLTKLFELITEQGAEGIMLRRPKSIYECKKSNTLFKMKKFLDDEATVIGYEESEINTKGKSHLIGSMGALICKTDSGIQFKIGSGFSDAQRLSPPKIGSRITFQYQGLSEIGKPRIPTFHRERNE